MNRLFVSGASAFALLAFGGVHAQGAVQGSGQVRTGSDGLAQGSAVSADALGTVVVTAERRQESVQKSSLVIQALSGADITKAGVTQATDLNAVIPGIQIAMGGSEPEFYVRGVGDDSATPLGNPAVAFNVDGVYVARGEDISANFYDIARVEVLKGPQGTLYGRNAAGGAINLITRAPKLGVYTGDASLDVGNYGLVHFEGGLNLPLNSTMAVRAAFNLVNRHGYLSDGTNDDVERAGRLRFLWKPTENLSANLNFDAAHLGGKGPGYVLHPQLPGQNPWVTASSPQGVALMEGPLIPLPGRGPTPLILPINGENNRQDNNFWNVSAEVNYQLPFATLTLLPAYRDARVNWTSDPGVNISEPSWSHETTMEARLGNSVGRAKWVAGLYYYNEDQGIGEDIPGSLFIPGLYTSESMDTHTDSAAAFSQVTYSIIPTLRLTGGARYTYQGQSLSGSYFDLTPTALSDAPATLLESFGARHTWYATTWKAGAEYDLAPHHMLFFTASTGFKAGGLNQTIPPLASYGPEKLTAYEFGSRNRFFDDRLQLNLELFNWKYRAIQGFQGMFDPAGVFNVLTLNDGDASIRGFDLDVTALVTAADKVHASVEYADSRYDRYQVTVPYSVFGTQLFKPASTGCPTQGPTGTFALQQITENCTGFQLARSPRWSGSFGYDHRFELSNSAVLIASASGQFASARWMGPDFTSIERAKAYTIANVDLTYMFPDGDWQVTGYVHNLGNTAIYTGGTQRVFVTPLFYATINPPRTYGLRVRYSF